MRLCDVICIFDISYQSSLGTFNLTLSFLHLIYLIETFDIHRYVTVETSAFPRMNLYCVIEGH